MTIRIPEDLKLPLYRISIMRDGEQFTFEFRGILDCRQIGSLIFTDQHGTILKILASGHWLEATQIEESLDCCLTCGKDR